MNAHRSATARRLLVMLGMALLFPSLIWLALSILGFANADVVAIGDSSGIKTIAGIAVLACLLTAVGYSDDY